MLTVLGALGSSLACGSPASRGEGPREGDPDPCVRAYQGTVHSLEQLMASSGVDHPSFPPVEDYVIRCRATGLDDSSLLCLDPSVALAEPTRCAPALDAARPAIEALSAWFAEQATPRAEPHPIGGQP